MTWAESFTASFLRRAGALMREQTGARGERDVTTIEPPGGGRAAEAQRDPRMTNTVIGIERLLGAADHRADHPVLL